MKYAQKKRKIVLAYQLGAHTPMESELIQEGTIRVLPDGSYALFSQEAVNGAGEIALPGDYFKVDTINGKHYPYPNSKAYFDANHHHIEGNTYEQISKTVAIWQDGDEPCEEMDFLLSTNRLTLCPQDNDHYFNAHLCGAPLSAGRDATVVFYKIDRDSQEHITDILFNFVARQDFERDYILREDTL